MRIKQITPRAWWPPHVDEVRIISPKKASLPNGQILSSLITLGHEVHGKIRNGADLRIADYARGQSLLASDEFNKLIYDKNPFIPLLFSVKKVVGSNFPGSLDPLGMVGEHHVTLVQFTFGAVLIDAAAAEFLGHNYKFANTQVLLIPTEHEDIVSNLTAVYGGDWRIKE